MITQVIEQKRDNVDRSPFGLDLAHTWMKFATISLSPLTPRPSHGHSWTIPQMAGVGRLLAFLKASFQALLAKKV